MLHKSRAHLRKEQPDMPKLKTKKGAAKRFRFTKKKKIKYTAIGRGHILTKKETKRKRKLRKPAYVEGKNIKYLRRLLPYG